MNNPLTMIPDTARMALYVIFALAGVVIGVSNILEIETLLSVTLDKWNEIISYLSIAFGATAASNVTRKRREEGV